MGVRGILSACEETLRKRESWHLVSSVPLSGVAVGSELSSDYSLQLATICLDASRGKQVFCHALPATRRPLTLVIGHCAHVTFNPRHINCLPSA